MSAAATTICAWCNRLKCGWAGDPDASHDICPECLDAKYPKEAPRMNHDTVDAIVRRTVCGEFDDASDLRAVRMEHYEPRGWSKPEKRYTLTLFSGFVLYMGWQFWRVL